MDKQQVARLWMAMWPEGILPGDFERALTLAEFTQGKDPEVAAEVRFVRSAPAPRRAKGEGMAKMKALLRESGRAWTATEIIGELGCSRSAVRKWGVKLSRMVRYADGRYQYRSDKSEAMKGRKKPKNGERAVDKIEAALGTGGATYRELAQALGMPLGTVSSSLHELKKRKKVKVSVNEEGVNTYSLAS